MKDPNPSLEKSENSFDYQEFTISTEKLSSSTVTEKENSFPSPFDRIANQSPSSFDDYSEYDGSLSNDLSRSPRDTSFNSAIECPYQTKKRYQSIGLRCTGLRKSR